MSKELDQLKKDLSAKKAEGKVMANNPEKYTGAQINAKTEELRAIQAKIELQEQIEAAKPSSAQHDDMAANAAYAKLLEDQQRADVGKKVADKMKKRLGYECLPAESPAHETLENQFQGEFGKKLHDSIQKKLI